MIAGGIYMKRLELLISKYYPQHADADTVITLRGGGEERGKLLELLRGMPAQKMYRVVRIEARRGDNVVVETGRYDSHCECFTRAMIADGGDPCSDDFATRAEKLALTARAPYIVWTSTPVELGTLAVFTGRKAIVVHSRPRLRLEQRVLAVILRDIAGVFGAVVPALSIAERVIRDYSLSSGDIARIAERVYVDTYARFKILFYMCTRRSRAVVDRDAALEIADEILWNYEEWRRALKY